MLMTLLVGLVLTLAALAAFAYSMPRGGKTAKFVGSKWEGYIVVGMICVFGLGLMMMINGAT
jgi:hypothetical protein